MPSLEPHFKNLSTFAYSFLKHCYCLTKSPQDPLKYKPRNVCLSSLNFTYYSLSGCFEKNSKSVKAEVTRPDIHLARTGEGWDTSWGDSNKSQQLCHLLDSNETNYHQYVSHHQEESKHWGQLNSVHQTDHRNNWQAHFKIIFLFLKIADPERLSC